MSDLLPDNPPGPDNGYTVDSTMDMTAALFNSILSSIHDRLAAREELEADFEALIAEGTSAGLTMIQENIAPQLVALQNTIAASQDAIEEMMAGTAPDAAKLGNQLPAYYLDPANFAVSGTIKSLLAAADAAAARDALDVSNVINTTVVAAVEAAVDSLLDGSPAALDTLKELADALGNDADFAATMTAALTGKLSRAGGTMEAGAVVTFASEVGDKLRLYGSGYGLGVEASTLNYWGGGTHRFRGSGGSAGAILGEIVGTATQPQHLTRKDYVDALKWIDLAPVATASGTAVDWTSIPAGVSEVELWFNRVSGNGADHFLIQIGTGAAPTETGYKSGSGIAGSNFRASATTGFILWTNIATTEWLGCVRLHRTTGNTWVEQHAACYDPDGGGSGCAGGGAVSLAGALNNIRLRSLGGTQTFDNGSVKVRYR